MVGKALCAIVTPKGTGIRTQGTSAKIFRCKDKGIKPQGRNEERNIVVRLKGKLKKATLKVQGQSSKIEGLSLRC